MEIDVETLCRRVNREQRDGYLIANCRENTAGHWKWYLFSTCFATILRTRICFDSFYAAFAAGRSRGVRVVSAAEAEKYCRQDSRSYLPFMYPSIYERIVVARGGK